MNSVNFLKLTFLRFALAKSTFKTFFFPWADESCLYILTFRTPVKKHAAILMALSEQRFTAIVKLAWHRNQQIELPIYYVWHTNICTCVRRKKLSVILFKPQKKIWVRSLASEVCKRCIKQQQWLISSIDKLRVELDALKFPVWFKKFFSKIEFESGAVTSYLCGGQTEVRELITKFLQRLTSLRNTR